MKKKRQNIPHSHGIRITGTNLGKLVEMQKSPECQARPVVDRRPVISTT